MEQINLSKIKKAYIIGIKGSGVVAIAEILQAMGIEVVGSDTKEKFFTDKILQNLGIKYLEGFSEKNVPKDADLVVYSTAYNSENNPEFKLAKEKEMPMMSYPEILAHLFNQKYGLAVCGTHGKTTTSALLASTLKNCGADPSAVIGSQVLDWHSNALIGQGKYFVIEADEFQNKLKLYNPKAILLTSIDWDHPDFFKTFGEYKQAFVDFAGKIFKAGFVVACGDDTNVLEVMKNTTCDVIKYGFAEDNDIIITNYQLLISNENISKPIQRFEIIYKEENLGEFEIQLVGKHNVLNSAGVIAVCHKLNLDLDKVREALKNFQGTSRRFEIIGERNGAILIDDYGHHPEEIKATLKATRAIYLEKNIIAVFQPHSYSRTEALLPDFAQSFDDADEVLVMDIYGSAREYSGDVSSKNVVDLINKFIHNKAEYLPKAEDVVKFLKNKISANDVVIAIGAGNGFEVVEKLKK